MLIGLATGWNDQWLAEPTITQPEAGRPNSLLHVQGSRYTYDYLVLR
jgi:hypothetical protein